jgi:hypothetical protein
MSQTITRTTIIVPSNPKPSIVFRLSKRSRVFFRLLSPLQVRCHDIVGGVIGEGRIELGQLPGAFAID